MIDIMARKRIDVYYIKETWLDGDFIRKIDWYAIFHHGLKEQTCSRGKNGVAIILSPTFSKYYKLSGSLPPVIPKEDDISMGRFIGIKLDLKVKILKKGAFRKKIIKFETIKLFISSAYHPVHEKDQVDFNTFLSSIYSSVPKSYFLASGQDMNANIGCKNINDKFSCIGKHGFKNRNSKGTEAINLLNMHNLFASSTFFQDKNYTSWRSFDGKNTPYNLDQWITNSLENIQDSKVVDFGIPSDHSAMLLCLKFKNPKNNKISPDEVIDWNLLLDKDIKSTVNDYLSAEIKKIRFGQEDKLSYC